MSNNIPNNYRIARNSILLSIRMVFVLCLTLYTTRVVLAVLGVEDYGVYNVVCGFVSMFTFLNTSISNGIQRFYNFELSIHGIVGARQVFCSAIILQVALSLIILILAESIGLWYIQKFMVIPIPRLSAANIIYQTSIISFLLIFLQAPLVAAIFAHEDMDFYAIVTTLDAILKFIIALVIKSIPMDKLIMYGSLLMGVSLIDFLLYFIFCKVKYQDEIKWKYTKDYGLITSMLNFSGWNIFGSLSGVLKEQGINMILNLFGGPVINTARGISAQINAGIQGFVGNIVTPIRPQLIQAYSKKDYKRTIHLSYVISKYSCILLYLMALPISYEIDFILDKWLGGNVPPYTAAFVIIIFVISLFNNLNAATSAVVHATGKMRTYQLVTSFITILSLPMAYFALKLGYSYTTALWIVALMVAITQYAALRILKRLITFSLTEYLKRVIIPIVLTITLTIWIPYISKVFLPVGWERLFITTIISTIAIICTFLIIGITNTERQFIIALIKKTINRR